MRSIGRALLIALPGTIACSIPTFEPWIQGMVIYMLSVFVIARNPSKSLWMDLGMPFLIGGPGIVYSARHHWHP